MPLSVQTIEFCTNFATEFLKPRALLDIIHIHVKHLSIKSSNGENCAVVWKPDRRRMKERTLQSVAKQQVAETNNRHVTKPSLGNSPAVWACPSG